MSFIWPQFSLLDLKVIITCDQVKSQRHNNPHCHIPRQNLYGLSYCSLNSMFPSFLPHCCVAICASFISHTIQFFMRAKSMLNQTSIFVIKRVTSKKLGIQHVLVSFQNFRMLMHLLNHFDSTNFNDLHLKLKVGSITNISLKCLLSLRSIYYYKGLLKLVKNCWVC